MRSSGRNLHENLHGDDVALLQHQLRQLGHETTDEDGFFGPGTHGAVVSFQEAQRLETNGVVDRRTGSRIDAAFDGLDRDLRAFKVRGRVHSEDGEALTRGKVRAFDHGLRRREPLGEARLDDGGLYEIDYAAASFTRDDKKRADLVIEVHAARARKQSNKPLKSSAIIFKARPLEVVDVALGDAAVREPSEFETVASLLGPLLKAEGREVTVEDLNRDDIPFLTGETDLDAQTLTSFVAASKLGGTHEIAAESYYALLRNGVLSLPGLERDERPSLDRLLEQSPDSIRSALELGIERNLIPGRFEDSIGDVVTKLEADSVDRTARGEGALGALLRSSPLLAEDDERIRVFTRAFRERKESGEKFWDELRGRAGLGAAVVEELQTTLVLGEITSNHRPMVAELQKRRTGAQRSLRDLASLELTDWRELVAKTGAPPDPSTERGEEREEREQRYAEALHRAVEARYPTAVLAHRLAPDALRAEVPGAEIMHRFLTANPELELGTREATEAIEAIEVNDEKAEVKVWRRLFNLAPVEGRFGVVTTLRMHGVTSALEIVDMGPAAARRMLDAQGGRQLEAVLARSRQIHDLSLAVATDNLSTFHRGNPWAIQSKPDVHENATLAALFGSMDFCACEHCNSIYGPAAYFADLLNFLKHAPGKDNGDQAPLQVILDRRPDLVEIELSCQNTNTVLPYVDLVNEVLENAVTRFHLEPETFHPDQLNTAETPPQWLKDIFREPSLAPNARLNMVRKGTWWEIVDDRGKFVLVKVKDREGAELLSVNRVTRHQTSSTREELSALPEHLNEQAYVKLASAVYPLSLPFDLWYREVRLCLEHLGFERYRWIEKLLLDGPLPATPVRPKEVGVALDYLGISERESALIAGPIRRGELRKLWGFGVGLWENSLKGVPTFMKRAGFDESKSGPGADYRELRNLILGARFINVKRGLEIRFDDDACDLSKARIHVAEGTRWDEVLDRTLRFLRLQRQLGWTIRELDQAIAAFLGDGTIGQGFLVQVADVARLRKDLDVPHDEMLSWWGTIDTAEDLAELVASRQVKSLYERLFLSKTLEQPADVFALNEDRTALDSNEALEDHLLRLVGPLRASVEDLARLVTETISEEQPPPKKLTLESLTVLFRHVSLARALDLSVTDLLRLISLSGLDPFYKAKTANTRRFVKVVRKVQASGFTVAELDYLLRHHVEREDDVEPIAAEMAQILSELAGNLRKEVAAPDPEGELTRAKLVQLLPEDKVDEVFKVVSGQSEKTVEDQQQLIDHLSDFLDAEEAKTRLLDAGDPQEKGQRFGFVLRQLVNHLRRNLVTQHLSAALGLEADVGALLLEVVLEPRIAGNASALDDFLVLAGGGLTATYYPSADLSGNPAAKRTDGTVNFAQGWEGMTPPELADTFSVRWRGMVRAERSDGYTFTVNTTGGARLRLNNRLLVDLWPPQPGPVETFGSIELEAGKLYPLELEFTTTNRGPIELTWSKATDETEVVPAESLLPAAVLDGYCLLAKNALLATRLALRADDLRYLSQHKVDFEGLDLNAWLIAESAYDKKRFAQWQRLDALVRFRRQYHERDVRLIDVLGAAQVSVSEARKQLLLLTGWDEKEYDDLAGPNGFALSQQDLKCGEHFLDLHEAMHVIHRVGISAKQLIDWSRADLGAEIEALDNKSLEYKRAILRDVWQVIKAKYGEPKWLDVARPIRDVLRREQRDALVKYLLHDLRDIGIAKVGDLYEHFLVDVEMNPCMMTSRIKLAISSVQLFVQRCLLNLEQDAHLAARDAREWRWRKNYRLWEANRKVFLYPENWIYPELRDDRSPFFEELQDELLQNELTDTTAEAALMSYLRKLNDVARLEMIGMYHQKETEDNIDNGVLHVIGRTQGKPPSYYYRRRMEELHWTPWERIDLDIEGDHVIPVVWNRRLYLFWALFRDKTIERTGSLKRPSGNEGAKRSHEYLELTFAWSEYREGRWSARRETNESLEVTFDTGMPTPDQLVVPVQLDKDKLAEISWVNRLRSRSDLSFKPLFNKDELILRVYGWFKREKWPFADLRFTGCGGSVTVNKGFEKLMRDSPNVRQRADPAEIFDPSAMLLEPRTNSLDLELPYFQYKGSLASLDLATWQDWVKLRDANKKETVLAKTSPFSLLAPPQYLQFDAHRTPFFFQDDRRTFLVSPKLFTLGFFSGADSEIPGVFTQIEIYKYRFETFYHPFSGDLIKQLKRYGIAGLFEPSPDTDAYKTRRQRAHLLYSMYWHDLASSRISDPLPIFDFEFEQRSAYALYNWEIFFHAPFLIADQLSKNQRFEEAMKWFHFIFDPTDASEEEEPARFWRFRPFYEAYKLDGKEPQRIQRLMRLLNAGDEELTRQVDRWGKDPFNPHLIARLRTWAYPRALVMKYIDNLIAWGDQLFRRDSIESINEATQLYTLAAGILGPRPAEIPAKAPEVKTFSELEKTGFGPFSNVLLGIEDKLAGSSPPASKAEPGKEPARLPGHLYFCIPSNPNLLEYWDTVEDRLFKIRHCMNIEGVVRQLPLFQPPIDPALLVKARAAGVDIGSVLDDLNAPAPHYRFNPLAQKATELCADVRSLGGALLAALEKRDAEQLSLLRSSHEIQVLESVQQVREDQIAEAKKALDTVRKSKELTQIRRDYYRDIEDRIDQEKRHLDHLGTAHILNEIAHGISIGASVALAIPDIEVGAEGWASTPKTAARFGGTHLGNAINAAATTARMYADMFSYQANRASIEGSYERRWNDWKHQERLAEAELKQIDEQIAAAEIRLAIAEKELDNHELQLENAKGIEDFLRSKLTGQDLYTWMVSQLSTLYFQSYQLAYDLARRAEKGFRRELGLEDSSFIAFGYWDSLKKGLLAGERLHLDIKRMEAAYLEQNRRELEVTKHVSLALLNPVALLKLKETGACFVSLPEAIFDLDHPGHYMRRIKTVSLTIPAVSGPYTSISCKLTLMENRIRKSTKGAVGEYFEEPPNDSRFIYNTGAVESIATSSARDDSGLFELSLRDERYLPFEGAGAVSGWRLELPKEFRQFDYDTITDVILHLRFTARDGGDTFRNKVVVPALTQALKDMKLAGENSDSLNRGLLRAFSIRHEFPDAWYRFLHPEADATGHELTIDLSRERFPAQFQDCPLKTDRLAIVLKLRNLENHQPPFTVHTPAGGQPLPVALGKKLADLDLPAAELPLPLAVAIARKDENANVEWKIEVPEEKLPEWPTTVVGEGDEAHTRLDANEIEDLLLFVHYTAS